MPAVIDKLGRYEPLSSGVDNRANYSENGPRSIDPAIHGDLVIESTYTVRRIDEGGTFQVYSPPSATACVRFLRMGLFTLLRKSLGSISRKRIQILGTPRGT